MTKRSKRNPHPSDRSFSWERVRHSSNGLSIRRRPTAHRGPGPYAARPDGSGTRHGFSCVELVAAVFLFGATIVVWTILAPRFGSVVGAGGSAVTAALCWLVIYKFYLWSAQKRVHELQELEESYPGVYRINHVPTNLPCVIADGAQIQVGDYGWEAESFASDEFIYLQGLTEGWEVVWHAAFRPEHVEWAGEKPRTQYYLPYAWVCAGATPPPCPFPVQDASEKSLGFPQRVLLPFVQGVKVKRQKRCDESPP